MNTSRNSVYQKAKESKLIAAYVLLPLIEFEFSFYGSNKPWISQSVKNTAQLNVLYKICKAHDWVTGPIKKFRENELSFKLSNKGFSEIYKLAGPLADKNKNVWAKLLVERTGKLRYKEEKIISADDVLRHLKSRRRPVSIREICIALQRLPNSIERHLKNLREAGLVVKNESGFFVNERAPANSSP